MSRMDICSRIAEKLPCRKKIVAILVELIGYVKETFPDAIHLFGQPGTGKTAITRQIFREIIRQNGRNMVQVAFVNCIESYTPKILFHNIILQLCGPDEQLKRLENLQDFIDHLRQLQTKVIRSYIIGLDNAERLRDMDANVLTSMIRLKDLTGLNICVILISQIPFEKFFTKAGLTNVISIYCPQYSKSEALQIISSDYNYMQNLLSMHIQQTYPNDLERKLKIVKLITPEFFDNYLDLLLCVVFKVCRDLTEIRITARKCFLVYMEPVLNDDVPITDVSRLWRSVAGPLRTALSQVYMRVSLPEQTSPNDDKIIRKLAQSLQLPYYGKYLLIAAFLASYNSTKEDKRLFVKNHGKRRKRMQTVNANAKPTEKMSTSIGPKSFSVDRLLAIFYAILEEKVGLTCNLLSQVSTLVNLKLLSFVSNESAVDGSSRLQCTISLDFVLCISQNVGFNIRQYLGIS